MAALPLEGLMRARAQNRFVLAVSVAKLALTVPLVILGFRAFGLRGAMGGWVAAEAVTRGILLVRAGQLFGSISRVLPWRTLAFQALGTALAAPVGIAALRISGGPLCCGSPPAGWRSRQPTWLPCARPDSSHP